VVEISLGIDFIRLGKPLHINSYAWSTKWSLYEQQPLKMAIKWSSASDDSVAACRSWMYYFFSVRQATTNGNPDIRICHSTKFTLELNTGSGSLSEVNKITTLFSHCACAAWKNGACSVGS